MIAEKSFRTSDLASSLPSYFVSNLLIIARKFMVYIIHLQIDHITTV